MGSCRSGRSPVGQVTRGTTGTNRLRRVDRWIARHPALRRAADPLVVDLGYGASGVTALELACAARASAAGRRGARPRDRTGARGAGDARSSPRCAVADRRSLRRGVSRSRSAGSRCRPRRPAARRHPRDERAPAVRRARGRGGVGSGWPRASRPAACSSRAPATRLGRIVHVGRDGRGRARRARSRRRCGSPGWSIRRSPPSGCRRRSSTATCPASACTHFLARARRGVGRAPRGCPPFGPVQRWEQRADGDADAGWPLPARVAMAARRGHRAVGRGRAGVTADRAQMRGTQPRAASSAACPVATSRSTASGRIAAMRF